MTGTLVFAPLLPWVVTAVLAAIAAVASCLSIWRGLRGWPLRTLASALIVAALTGPSYQQEDRDPLTDIVILAADESASNQLSDRSAQVQEAMAALEAALSDRAGTELRRIVISDGEDDSGTRLLDALAETLSEEPRARIAGMIAITDGHIHDIERALDLPAPLHLLLTGRESDWDRRLIVKNAPAYAIIGESVTLTLRVEDSGKAPPGAASAPLDVAIDGGDPQRFSMPIGQDVDVPLTLNHGGRNVIQFSVPVEAGELTDRNNTALIQMNGIRDRLRVLLVSGEPHSGGRTWRNLLKSDSSVDLVHFTILRPPEKQDGVPVSELSLIAFPTRELFLERVDDFDLIIFDRYKRRGILPSLYIENIVRYVREGGAVLVSAGPDFASADSLYRSPLGEVLPASPSARVIEQAYTPAITDLGRRHPVTSELPDSKNWGPWLRQVELQPPEDGAQIVMEGVDGRPLLILDRVGDGRVALLASDQAWLWSRGYDGGGPQLELLRRLAHWMMGEPDLEEETLTAIATGQTMRVERRSLNETVPPLTVTGPDGSVSTVELTEISPGKHQAQFEGDVIGLYRLEDGEQSTVIGLGPAAPKEFEATVATDAIMADRVSETRGGILRLEDGFPRLRNVREGRPASGRNWIGLTPHNAYETTEIRLTALMPPWLVLVLIAGLIVTGWLREGRRV